MAMEMCNPFHPMLWIWSQDGPYGCRASEFNPQTGTFTGRTFDGQDLGIAGGACAYNAGNDWYLVGLHQGFPDVLAAYSLNCVKMPLVVDVEEIWAHTGGVANFLLNAGPGRAGLWFYLLGSMSGTSPGMMLPGGLILPINQDCLTRTLLFKGWGFGRLNAHGQANVSLKVPPIRDYSCLQDDLRLCFAYTSLGFDFVSNPACFWLRVTECPDEFFYDDGSSENLLGRAGGTLCWMHCFDAGLGCTIDTIRAAWGSAFYSGYGPGNGAPCTVYVWEDPTDDCDPTDCMLLDMVDTVTQNYDTDILNDIPLHGAIAVKGKFFVGAALSHLPLQYVAPVDESSGYESMRSWVSGVATGPFDPFDLSNNDFIYEMGAIGFPCYFLLRAK